MKCLGCDHDAITKKGWCGIECYRKTRLVLLSSIPKGRKVKCRRCRTVFRRQKNETFRICARCREHCVRCDVLLTSENKDETGKYMCKSCVAAMVRQTTDKERRKDYDLLRWYGITLDEYNQLLTSQNGVCWICKSPPTNRRLAVDHRHEKGEKRKSPREIRSRVRGLLCWHCNRAISSFKDSPSFLRNAAEYLELTPAQQVLSGEKHDSPKQTDQGN